MSLRATQACTLEDARASEVQQPQTSPERPYIIYTATMELGPPSPNEDGLA